MMGPKVACVTGATGNSNVIIGQCASMQLSTGTSNVIMGPAAGRCITTGCSNVILGNAAGIGVTTGNYNVFLGGGVGSCGFPVTILRPIDQRNDLLLYYQLWYCWYRLWHYASITDQSQYYDIL